jgi:hypothetical protein
VGPPGFNLVGLRDAALHELKDRAPGCPSAPTDSVEVAIPQRPGRTLPLKSPTTVSLGTSLPVEARPTRGLASQRSGRLRMAYWPSDWTVVTERPTRALRDVSNR